MVGPSEIISSKIREEGGSKKLEVRYRKSEAEIRGLPIFIAL
jgi:hypothetical protein